MGNSAVIAPSGTMVTSSETVDEGIIREQLPDRLSVMANGETQK